jgi:hypothetical protein
VRGSVPDHERLEAPAVSRYTFDRGDQGPLGAYTSIVSHVIPANKHLERPKHAQQHPRLIHVIHVFGQYSRVGKFFANYGEPVYSFLIYRAMDDTVYMLTSVYCTERTRLSLVTLVERLHRC